MKDHFRALRTVLSSVFLLTLYFAYMLMADHALLMQIYDVGAFDDMHRYLAMTAGTMLVVVAVGAGLAFLQPLKYASVVILLIVYHFARFVIDVVLLAQGEVSMRIVIPEMVYFVVVFAALIRYFPTKPKEEKKPVETTKPEPEVVATEPQTPTDLPLS